MAFFNEISHSDRQARLRPGKLRKAPLSVQNEALGLLVGA